MLSVRPKITDLNFAVFSRALHPELFEIHATRVVQRQRYSVTVNITNAGHLMTWQHNGLVLAEVATSAHHPLPQKRRLIWLPVNQPHAEQLDLRGEISYQCRFQLDRAEPQTFLAIQQELARDGECEGLVHRFESSGRMTLGAISYVHVESRTHTARIRAFHTFPDACAVLKCESVVTIKGT